MRNCVPKRVSDAPRHILSKSYDVPAGFVSPSFEAVYAHMVHIVNQIRFKMVYTS